MTTARAATLQETLRLKKLPTNGLGWHHELRRGLPYRSLLSVAKALKLSEKDMLKAMDISPRVAAARKKAKRLNCAESDLLYAIARAYVRLASFKPLQEATQWLVSKTEVLKGEIPLEMLHTRLGTEYVSSVIDRDRALLASKIKDNEPEEQAEEDNEDQT